MRLAITNIEVIANSTVHDPNIIPPQKWFTLNWERDPNKQSSQYWITGLKIIDKNDLIPPGWIKAQEDINAGLDTPQYLIYKKGGNEPPITDISFSNHPDGYKSVGIKGVYPNIAYLQEPLQEVAYEWLTQTQSEKNEDVSQISVARVNGQPAISYIESKSRLKYARYNGLEWKITTVEDNWDGLGSIEAFNIPVLNEVNGQPAIAYISAGGRLKYYWFNGNKWQVKDLDAAVTILGCSLTEVNGQPAISYTSKRGSDINIVDVKCTSFDGNNWNTNIVGSSEQMTPTSILTVNNKPAVIYLNYRYVRTDEFSKTTERDIILAQFDGKNWEHNPVIINADIDDRFQMKCAIVNGQPAICYSKLVGLGDNYELVCYWCDGNRWREDRLFPMNVAAVNGEKVRNVFSQPYFSLTEICSQPAILYILFAYLKDSEPEYDRRFIYKWHDGTTWRTVVDIAKRKTTPHETVVMVEINGQPAVIYQSDDAFHYLTRHPV